MKKFISGFITGAIMFSLIGAFAVSYVANPVDFKVLVNGKEFTSAPPALEIEGRTYLPLRAMGDALGVPVNWNEELRQAEVGTTLINSETTKSSINNPVQTNDKFKMTYKYCKSVSQIDDFNKAPDGKEYLLVFFEIENLTNETQNFSMFFLDSYIDDYKTPQSIIGYNIDDSMQLTVPQIEGKRKVKGYFAYEVNPNWQNLSITYNEDLLKTDTNNELKFNLNK